LLSKREIKALKHLNAYWSKDGGYLAGFRLDVTNKSYLKFRQEGLIEEAWTWASSTRPDIRISDKGKEALNDAN
jgi:hypothetical protein